MKKFALLALLSTLVIGVFGCGKKLPDGFPKVYPIKVTVVDGSTPLPDVRVAFMRAKAGSGGSFATGGSTDANGTALIQTTQGAFTTPGIPAGEYVVTAEDVMKIDLGHSPQEIVKMSRAEQGELEKKRQELIKAFVRKVPEALCKSSGNVADRSPIRFTAIEGNNELTIDISQYK